MITRDDLQEAIAECQGVRNPTASTAIKLAAFYTIRDHLFPTKEEEVKAYSYAQPPEKPVEEVTYESDSEFSQAIRGKSTNEVLAVVDEAMDVMKVMLPRLYAGIIRRLQE